MEFGHFILFDVCLLFSNNMFIPKFPQLLFIMPIYTLLVLLVYRCSRVDEKSNSNWIRAVGMTFYSQYTKYVGQLLGGTQWLVLILRRFGAQIGDDVIIDNMNSLYDVHLITIGDHARLSPTCQIQVKRCF